MEAVDKDIMRGVVFAVLMENHGGITDKSPDYVLEKWLAVRNLPNPEQLLDSPNKAKLNEWVMKWLRRFDKEV